MSPTASKHTVIVRRVAWNDLQDVPVFNDLSVGVETKNVDACVIAIARPVLVAVKNDEVALSDCPLKLHSLSRILDRHALEVIDKGLFAISDLRIVLNVGRPNVSLDGPTRLALVKHEVVECHRITLHLV